MTVRILLQDGVPNASQLHALEFRAVGDQQALIGDEILQLFHRRGVQDPAQRREGTENQHDHDGAEFYLAFDVRQVQDNERDRNHGTDD